MSDAERMTGRIMAVINASEEVIAMAKKYGNIDTVRLAKETAYDHIKGIADDIGYNPWQE